VKTEGFLYEKKGNIMKKLISISVSLIMLLSMIPTSVFAVNETEYENQQQNLFTYTFTEPTAEGENGKAVITGFVENYKELLGGSSEITIPDVYVNSDTGVKYNCELNATKSKFMQSNDFIKNNISKFIFKYSNDVFKKCNCIKNNSF
jgi:hypothetical protein